MPPANSRAASPPADSVPRAGTPPSYLSALRELESPVTSEVLNLAATLTTQAEDDQESESLRYLRSQAEGSQDDWRADIVRDRLRRAEERGEDRERRERLRRVMNRLSRIHDPPAYGDRIPSQNNLYDWSPANEADDEEELDQILAELRREQPNTHPEILRVLGRSQLDAERESRIRAYSSRLLNSNQPSQSADSSLRSAAILQSVRRHPRFSARTRDSMQRYNSDRDSASRSPHHSESRDRTSPSRPLGSTPPFDRTRYYRYEVTRHAWQAQQMLQRSADRQNSLERRLADTERDIRSRIDSHRRSYLDHPASSPSTTSPRLELAIEYLSRLRHSTSEDDSWSFAFDAGLFSKGSAVKIDDDVVLDTGSLPPPAETSWLAPGAVLSGCQHATTVTSTVTPATSTGSSTTLYRFRNNDTMTSTILDSSRPWLSNSSGSYLQPRSMASGPEVVTSHAPQQDRWPVKVTIHAVDYANMSLSATMEAYNVPSHPHTLQTLLNPSSNPDNLSSPFTRTSSITTYLEGEILDFNSHTLLTESFKSSPGTDATYWRKLPPFQKYTDDELCQKLLSKRWITEELSKEWILMRWKERCFVKSLNNSTSSPAVRAPLSPSPSSLSISSTTAQVSFNHTRDLLSNQPSNSNSNWGSGHDLEQQFDDSGCGLTISGFYYVCLRRRDGYVEGLYYDPQSSPYQCLKLESVNGGVFPAWGFR